MWKCPHCGTEVENNFDLCWNCGTTQDGGEQVNIGLEGEREVTPSPTETVNSSTSSEMQLRQISFLRPSIGTILVAATLPLIYLFFAGPIIIECSQSYTYLQWYSAEVLTIPVSVVAALSAPHYHPGLVGYLTFAVLNALAMFVVCYIGIHVWNACEIKLSQGNTTSNSHQTHPLAIPAIVGAIPGFFAGSIAFSMTMGFMGPVGAIASFAVTAVFVTGLVGFFVYLITRRM
ncbi:MAG: hypothetical protein V4719_19055 [Planctomycetota bacterium]